MLRCVLIRRERVEDVDGIAAVQHVAFASTDRPEPPEPALVAALRADEAWIPELSLVAERDGDVVGHVCLTRGHVDTLAVAALGPIGVAPKLQRSGIGSALVHASLAAADAMAAEKLRDLSQPIDVRLLDATVSAFYGTGSREEVTATPEPILCCCCHCSRGWGGFWSSAADRSPRAG